MAVRVQRALALAFAVTLLGAGSLAPRADASLYLALGDSVSGGGGAGAGRGFVDLYQAYLRNSGRTDALTNLAVGGDTSSSMRYPGGQLDRALAAINEPSDTSVLTLDIGGNDGGYGQCPNGFNSAPCPFGANYTAILDALATALANDPGDESFQVMQYYNPASGTGSTTEDRYNLGLLGSDAKVDCAGTGAQLGLNDLIACIGRDHGAVAVDTYPTFNAHGQAIMADSLHPNEVGHAYIACLFEYPGTAGSANPCAADQVAPRIRLSVRRTQRVLRRHGVSVVVRTDEESVVTASGRVRLPGTSRFVRFRRVTRSVHANTPTRITIRPTRKGMAALRRALCHRSSLRSRIAVVAKDLADNSGRATRRITLVR
jgi:lysophospholipase L1-like esterase